MKCSPTRHPSDGREWGWIADRQTAKHFGYWTGEPERLAAECTAEQLNNGSLTIEQVK